MFIFLIFLICYNSINIKLILTPYLIPISIIINSRLEVIKKLNQVESKNYRKLQEHLDTLPIGYPATESGVELRILEFLFSPEEDIFLNPSKKFIVV